jgi:hypothetical protein
MQVGRADPHALARRRDAHGPALAVLGKELRFALVELGPFAQASDGHARTGAEHSEAHCSGNA